MRIFFIVYIVLLALFFALIINLARCNSKQGIKTYRPFKLECDCWGKYCPECWDKETTLMEELEDTVVDDGPKIYTEEELEDTVVDTDEDTL
ncbi:MAG: hypothetical protein GF334_08465 [Candidatus Altiarchaeales archaeon]|nr:hypothetical protein [Candidatus Altiarchaeales archaeon]